ncbi:MAG: hypothetical protein FD135_419 [Comamonadaceae bacterium]|nr:MAG: hypothetical protein FD135_419 [Comamonadaceae bacterium]
MAFVWRFLLVALGLSLAGLSATAQPSMVMPRVIIVSSDNTAAYMEAAQTLIAELGRNGISSYDIRRLNVSEWQAQADQMTKAAVYVTLGTRATETLVAVRVSSPILAALIPRSSFERVLRSGGRKPSSGLTAIYLDQSLARQLALIRLAMPQARRIGVLWGADSWSMAPTLRALMDPMDLTLTEAGLEESHRVFPDLQQVLNDSDVFLALADPVVFNSNTIQNILLTTFRAKVPVVAFSPAYVRAGALLALHTTPEQVGRQAAGLVQDVLNGKSLPEKPVESNDFEVSVNAHVGRAFNLSLDGKALRSTLRRLEHLP